MNQLVTSADEVTNHKVTEEVETEVKTEADRVIDMYV